MRHLAEAVGCLAAHPLRRRIGRDPLGVFPLQCLELAHERVVLKIIDLRRIQHVVQVFVMAQLLTQRVHAALRIGRFSGSGHWHLPL